MIDVRPIPLDDRGLGSIHRLHNVLFRGTDASLEWVRWYMRMGQATHPGLSTRAYGAFDGDDLIGMWCVEPRTFDAGRSDRALVGRCFAVGIHPDYQRRGLFVELSLGAIQHERRLGEYRYVLGIPQVGRPVIEAHLKSGWERVQDIDMLAWPVSRPDRPRSLREARPLRYVSDAGPTTPRSGDFIDEMTYGDARWSLHPDNAYVRLGWSPGSYVVAKQYGEAFHVLRMQGHASSVEGLLTGVKTLAYRHRAKEVNLWCASNDWDRSEVESLDFATGARFGSSVSLLAVRIRADRPLELDSCHLQMGSDESY